MNIPKEVVQLMQQLIANGIVSNQGLSQEHWTVLTRDAICETIFTEYSREELATAPVLAEQVKGEPPVQREAGVLYQQDIKRVRAELYSLLYVLGNISAVRQKFEQGEVLKKSEGGRKSADATALANKYA